MTHSESAAYHAGVLVALGIVYEFDAQIIAEGIVEGVGPHALLKAAELRQDVYLPQLRETVQRVARWRRLTDQFRQEVHS